MRPVVPDVEVPGVGVGEVDDAAPVVVELDVDPVERDGAVEHVVHGRVGIHALRRRREVVGLARVGVHERAQLRREGHEVLRRGFEVEVETVDDGGAEGSVRRGRVGAEQAPDGVCRRGGRCGIAEAALGVRGTADRQQDGLALALAVLDILPVAFLG